MTPNAHLEAADATGETTAANERRLLLKGWESAFAPGSVIYLSGPITTGPRFFAWYAQFGRRLDTGTDEYRQEIRRHVVIPNSREIVDAATAMRQRLRKPVLEPATLEMPQWSQNEYLTLWEAVIERFAERVVLLPGWEYSTGCARELCCAFKNSIPVEDLNERPISADECIQALRKADEHVHKTQVPISALGASADELQALKPRVGPIALGPVHARKDEVLDALAESFNVAQFVAFEPTFHDVRQTFCRIIGYDTNHKFGGLRTALAALLHSASDHAINLRSYALDGSQSREFIYGLRNLDEAVSAARRLRAEGLHVIANETIDIHDGGVSGVVMGDTIEFAPDDTPRCVEEPGVASLPRSWGVGLLRTVYGFTPALEVPAASRLEFSIHPIRRGWRHTHTLAWEYSPSTQIHQAPAAVWPNRFSRLIGDKVFGLLIANCLGLKIPQTRVINRRVAPFSFGEPTSSSEVWLRTSPPDQQPGRFTTRKGWRDPFELLQAEDPSGTEIASILSQDAVTAQFSGAAIVASTGDIWIEGAVGEGDTLMLGKRLPHALPKAIERDVRQVYERVSQMLGPVRFEWVHDGANVWIVQFHRGATESDATTVVPGSPARWIHFNSADGLEQLRDLVTTIGTDVGIVIDGGIGLTSHLADVIRRAGVPARINTG